MNYSGGHFVRTKPKAKTKHSCSPPLVDGYLGNPPDAKHGEVWECGFCKRQWRVASFGGKYWARKWFRIKDESRWRRFKRWSGF